jgi:hypothetical protein
LVDRIAFTQSTRDQFAGEAFAWGKVDCAKMAHFHLSQFGHPVPNMPHYKSAGGARVALRAVGYETLEALFDAMLERIPPAAMLPGDLALMEGQKPFDALTICAGVKVFGWHEEHEVLVNIRPLEIKASWRV